MPKCDAAIYAQRKQAERAARKLKREKWEASVSTGAADPFYKLSRQIRINAKRLQKYIGTKRYRGTAEQRGALLLEMHDANARFLAANNPEARLRFYCAWSPQITNFLFGRKGYHLTVTPHQFTFKLADAEKFDIEKIRQWILWELRGFDFLGIIEVARYSIPHRGSKPSAMFSFHVHIVVACEDYRKLKNWVVKTNDSKRSFLLNRDVAVFKKITNVETLSVYMHKDPYTNYRVRVSDVATDPSESRERHQKQRTDKATLSPKYQLEVRSVMRGKYLDKLIFAGGTGIPFMKTIRRDALAALPYSQRKDRELVFGCKLEHDVSATAAMLKSDSRWVRARAGFMPSDKQPLKVSIQPGSIKSAARKAVEARRAAFLSDLDD